MGHKSCIDHRSVDNCIFDKIIDNYLIYDRLNPFNHNVLYYLLRISETYCILNLIELIALLNMYVCGKELRLMTLYKANLDSKLGSCIMIMMLCIVMISTVIMMYIEPRSMRYVT